MSDRVLFAVAPFLALASLIVTAGIRTTRGDALASPTSTRHGWGRRTLPVFAGCGLLLGHLAVVVWPGALLRWTGDPRRLAIFEALLFLFAVAALVAAAGAIRRRLSSAAKDTGIVDAAFFGLMMLTIASGMATALGYRWAAAWSAATVTRYVRSILALRPDVAPLDAVPYVARLHLFASFVLVALVGFTRLIDGWLGPPARIVRWLIGAAASTVEPPWRRLDSWTRQASRRLLWADSEED
jgi:nitrate reductase gamma subunit